MDFVRNGRSLLTRSFLFLALIRFSHRILIVTQREKCYRFQKILDSIETRDMKLTVRNGYSYPILSNIMISAATRLLTCEFHLCRSLSYDSKTVKKLITFNILTFAFHYYYYCYCSYYWQHQKIKFRTLAHLSFVCFRI